MIYFLRFLERFENTMNENTPVTEVLHLAEVLSIAGALDGAGWPPKGVKTS